MLVLSRKKDERIVITDPRGVRGKIVVIEIRGDKVRLALDFPSDWTIHRQEVQDAVDAERRREAATNGATSNS